MNILVISALTMYEHCNVYSIVYRSAYWFKRDLPTNSEGAWEIELQKLGFSSFFKIAFAQNLQNTHYFKGFILVQSNQSGWFQTRRRFYGAFMGPHRLVHLCMFVAALQNAASRRATVMAVYTWAAALFHAVLKSFIKSCSFTACTVLLTHIDLVNNWTDFFD